MNGEGRGRHTKNQSGSVVLTVTLNTGKSVAVADTAWLEQTLALKMRWMER